MNFTGKNLRLIRDAIDGALSDIHMQIGGCPDPTDLEYAKAIEEYEQYARQLQKLAKRIDAALVEKS